ncbi:uncharacterized protein LOC111088418 isoform X1 [Limulus polyphemus]|uniref:Uncharacterized protein LOC111088418 isoform X1 n=1 Tax=Limulus polyphemus TaxID=6850 RepID=A0ABM1TE87_LIMPO|nr:uncharacterized protein LOC111088418 isoform X1 [Limulus polyphemus]
MSLLPAVVPAFIVFVLCSCIRIGICEKVMLTPVRIVASHKHVFDNISSGRVKIPLENSYIPLLIHNSINKTILTNARQTTRGVSEQTSDKHQSSPTNKVTSDELFVLEIEPWSLSVPAGVLASFLCSMQVSTRVTGVSFSWSFNDKLLVSSPNVSINDKTNLFNLSSSPSKLRYESVLSIFKTTGASEGEYGCEATLEGRTYTKKAKLYVFVNFHETCQRDDQCGWITGGDLPLQCLSERCACPIGYVFVQRSYVKPGCYREAMLFGNCQVNEQCKMPNTLCSGNGKCLCDYQYYFRYGEGCVKSSLDSKAKEVYTAAMISAACLMIAVFGIILTYIIRRSFSNRNTNTEQGNGQVNDVFTISDELGAIRALDKPPTYDEVVKREREVLGIPPPEYTDTMAACQNAPSLESCSNLETQPSNNANNSTITTELEVSIATIGNQDSDSILESTNLEGESANNVTHMSPIPFPISPYGESDKQQQEHTNLVTSATDEISKDNVFDAGEGTTSMPSTSYEKYYDNPIFHSE